VKFVRRASIILVEKVTLITPSTHRPVAESGAKFET
jgi:hypothetical protein